jgi:hypothetical protein
MQVTLVSPSFFLRGVAKVKKVLYVLVPYLEVLLEHLQGAQIIVKTSLGLRSDLSSVGSPILLKISWHRYWTSTIDSTKV